MGIRTPDLLIANETLYQLSYTPTFRGRIISASRWSRQAVFADHLWQSSGLAAVFPVDRTMICQRSVGCFQGAASRLFPHPLTFVQSKSFVTWFCGARFPSPTTK